SRLWTCRIDYRTSEAAAVVRDHAITGGSECRNLILPHATAASSSVNEHDRRAITTRIAIREMNAWQIRLTFARRRLSVHRHQRQRRQSDDGRDDRSVQSHSYLMWCVDFSFSLQTNSIISESTMIR